jgi:acetylornithine deacetylase/succinyl-diaminopimelate desuccinylase-like protein
MDTNSTKMWGAFFVLGMAWPAQPIAAQGASSALAPADVQRAVEAHVPAALASYRELLSYPNDARRPADLPRQTAYLTRRFEALGFQVSALPTAGVPVLLAERSRPGAERTVLVYLQADGQPVDTAAWHQGSPYTPVVKAPRGEGAWEPVSWERVMDAADRVAAHADQAPAARASAAEGLDRPADVSAETPGARAAAAADLDPAQAASEARLAAAGLDPEWRVFARSASDSKGPVAQLLAALEIARDLGVEPDFDLKIVLDSEEELGSPNLSDAVVRHRERLAADMLVIFDRPPHASGRPTLKFGARGIATVTLTTYGPRVPQHSGHYGNYAPNPAFRLAELLASMKDENGRVVIPGWYDGVSLDAETKRILADVPDDEGWIRRRLGIVTPDAVGDNLQEAVQYPSLNVRGMRSAWVGSEVRTIVPATAVAEIDVRLVRESDPDRLLGLLREHIASMDYVVLEREPTEAERLAHARIATFEATVSYGAFRTDFDSAPGRWLARACRRLYGSDPIRIRTSGGSIPISPFVETLGVPAVSVPTVNPDNNQHSPNENLRIGNFVEGLRVMLTILAEPMVGGAMDGADAR